MRFAVIRKIEFKYRNYIHSALVSSSGSHDESFIHIQLINSFPRKLFGVEHIRAHIWKGELKVNGINEPHVQQIAHLVNGKLEEVLKGHVESLISL